MPASAPRTAPGGRGFGIYIHWPFCLKKCPYCDFNSHVARTVDHARWRRALLAELERSLELTAQRPVESVFFGGGTPSLMAPATAAALLERIDERLGFAPNAEITLEANPTSVEAGHFADLAAAGVNRLSLGIQALDPAALKFLGREHSVAEALDALVIAKRHFPRVSFDLIYARPEQTLAAWQGELGRALELASGHLSLYQLTIEPGTAFHEKAARGELEMPGDDQGADLFAATNQLCAESGYRAYEISNYAQAGQASRHNLVYWRYGEYLGIGPGAHSRIGYGAARQAREQVRAPGGWLHQVERKGNGDAGLTGLEAEARADEMLLMGLRLSEGVSLDAFAAETGRRLEDTSPWSANLERLKALDLLEISDGYLRATVAGRPLLNTVLAELLS